MPNDDETAPGRKAPPRPAAAQPAKRPAARPAPVPEDPGDDRTEPRLPQRPAPPAARPVAARPVAPRQAAPPSGQRPRLPPDPDRTMGGGAAVPQKAAPRGVAPSSAPQKTSTMAQALTGGAQRAWNLTVGAVAGAVVLGVFGMWLVGRGHPVFGVVVMAAIIPLTFTALFVRKAPCPSCKQSITVIGIDRCPHCGSYVRLENQQPLLCEDGFIAPLATFETEIPLPIIPRCVWPEQGYCVVCGERAGDADETLDIQGTIIVIPHCGDHQEGVTWSIGISQTAVAIIILKFRSYSYYRKFLAANEVHTRSGMWR